MSLSVWLTVKQPVIRKVGTGVFIRDNGQTRELTDWEVAEKFPNAIVNTESDVQTHEVFTWNITHNLGSMADKADVYYALWRPEEKGWKYARDIIAPLEEGYRKLLSDPAAFKEMNPKNGWGDYEGLVVFVGKYMDACRAYPDAEIEVSR